MYKLLSHNDLDGVGCGILAKLAFGQEVTVRYNSVSSLNREIEFFLENDDPDTFLFITDLSPNEVNEKRLQEHFKEFSNVQLIDHHKTASHLNDFEWGTVLVEDEEGKLTSATSLFYQFLVANELLAPTEALSEFVELVRQYDTWEWEKNENQAAHSLNSLFYLVSIDEFEEKMIERLQANEHFDFDEFEKKLLSMEEDKIERYIRRKKREIVQAKVGDYIAGVVYAESYHSELGNELGKEHPHLDYIAILNMGGKRISLRTIHDHVDVSEIAGSYGGGGHQKASGCTLSDEAYKQFVLETFPLEPIQEDANRNRYNLKESTFGALYQNRRDETFLIVPKKEEWIIIQNNEKIKQTFSNFADGERYLKRNHEAWLVRDEVFVQYLMNEVRKASKRE
ncbi:oligoribonuclease NrnB/cAMP/cGMP phosphodiesterase (DHH superfamily) [Lysinibacillus composti]|uniref:Oligoribonuclease n=1 Tax=Lysinibacillus composti TaxID=720633 RepID=A0A3N9UGM4_9BACI|nr:oligoribonuclease [Lysinibacillus composti]MBM7608134.1 oligoribonuclease NrnB/cAMP/cGMP phosphodiesterase (DHH superfamily) [Lysinibacillus composti]RQW75205.1 oligoribonuclease [Lysinibacillus composti]